MILALACLLLSPIQDITSKADELLAAYEKAGRFSGTVLVAKGGRVVYEKGIGMANYELDVRNAPKTKFRIGSLTKQFTAMLIMMLNEDGKVGLDDPIGKYIESSPEAWKDVTIRHLLTHTGGIPNYTSDPSVMLMKREPKSLGKLIDSFRNKPLRFKPGEKFEYSNSGYALLTAVVEKASGTSWVEFLQSRILTPAGMADTDVDSAQTVLKNRASGYKSGSNGKLNADYIDLSLPTGAGAMYSTVGDFYKWDRALYTGKLVKQATLAQIYTPLKSNYAFGWVVLEGPRKTYTHDGGIDGFATSFWRYPSDDSCVVVFSNLQDAPAGQIAQKLSAILFGEPYELPNARKPIAVSAAILDSYVGEYQLTANFSIKIAREGDGLTGEATGQDKIALFASSETEFYLTAVEAEIAFRKSPDGTVTGLVLKQGGRETPGKKIK